MKWTDEKVEILKDAYEYEDLELLSNKLGVTVKAVIRKAQKLKLHRAKNNQIINGYKFCSLCQCEHPIDSFYKNKAKFDNLEYYCKKYYELKKLKKEKQIDNLPSTLFNQKRALTTDSPTFLAREAIKHRPKNPIIVKNDIEGKICNWCKKWKSLDEYGTDKNGIAGKKATCKMCYKERYSMQK